MSGICVPAARYGSLHRNASPSRISASGKSCRTASTAPSSEPRCSGICAACAISRPAASNNPTEQSRRSLMLVENEARIRFVPISSVIDRRRFENTSIRIGSARGRGVMLRLSRRGRRELLGRELVARVAEFAGHGGDRVLLHILDVLGREGAQDAGDALARAAAARLQAMRAEHAYL